MGHSVANLPNLSIPSRHQRLLVWRFFDNLPQRHGKMIYGSAFANYPFLSSEEFEEVCHQLDRTYCQAALGPLRRRWRLDVATALNDRPFSFGASGECSTFVRIRRFLDPDPDVEHGELASGLSRLALGKDGSDDDRKEDVDVSLLEAEDREMVDAEEADEVRASTTYAAICLGQIDCLTSKHRRHSQGLGWP